MIIVSEEGRILHSEFGISKTSQLSAHGAGLLRYFGNDIRFSDGLTSRALLTALSPWAEFLSEAAEIDFNAWFGECGGADAESKPVDDLECVRIFPEVRIDKPWCGKANINIFWAVVGVYKEPVKSPYSDHIDTVCSLSFLHPSKWVDLPIFLSSDASVVEFSPKFGGRCQDVADNNVFYLNKHHDAIECARGNSGEEGYCQTVMTVNPSFYDAIILGFLRCLGEFGSPEDTAREREEIERRMASIESGQCKTYTAEEVFERLRAKIGSPEE